MVAGYTDGIQTVDVKSIAPKDIVQVRCASTVAHKSSLVKSGLFLFCIPSPVSPKGRSAGFPSSCCSGVREWCWIGI